ncbi:hypothetical protein M446_0077 [Methylobacterium sp. 4-46]|uniref:DUF4186 domain-containing protein n=1 Tax=unclassified Methylobacterium TaxID=2615210 RepID=UPI000152DA3A|nr:MULTISPECIES: DUF4186 domain-containing protein [Methylobacterium]ACA14663.1 hypothetical protein M446_0077 [Methylobacterium sp. 4-46]WFT80417.1 DUF4186 domain-containing protein [Methylobacterium nodulans]
MRSLDEVFDRLPHSAFRRRFGLGAAERDVLRRIGWAGMTAHARDFVARRLAPARPDRDGKQTPFRGHPVFVAQHATATCCRGCLAKWHRIPPGRPLTPAEQDHVVAALARWLRAQAPELGQAQELGQAPGAGSAPDASVDALPLFRQR